MGCNEKKPNNPYQPTKFPSRVKRNSVLGGQILPPSIDKQSKPGGTAAAPLLPHSTVPPQNRGPVLPSQPSAGLPGANSTPTAKYELEMTPPTGIRPEIDLTFLPGQMPALAQPGPAEQRPPFYPTRRVLSSAAGNTPLGAPPSSSPLISANPAIETEVEADEKTTIFSALKNSGAAQHSPHLETDNIVKSEAEQKTLKEKPKKKTSWWRSTLEIIGVLLLAVIMSALVKTFLIQAFQIPSSSMEDTLQINDRLMISRLTPDYYPVKRGDIIVFSDSQNWLHRPPGTDPTGVKKTLIDWNIWPDNSADHLIKRVIGLPGDHISCDGKNALVINGVKITGENYLKPGVLPSEKPFEVTVPAGHVWVMGDNRSNSEDSRYHMDEPGQGFVPISDIDGKAVFRFWPLNRMGFLADTKAFDKVPTRPATANQPDSAPVVGAK